MQVRDLVEILAAMSSKRGDVSSAQELFLDMAERVVKSVSAEFSAKIDEVAILMATGDGQHLRFAAPRKFTELGTIPVTKRDSIAVSVYSSGTPQVTNNVPMVKHVSFFETVKIRDRVLPIQKMVTVPILHDGHAVGVVQISRKGETPRDAGADFTNADVMRANEIFHAVAPYLVQTRPQKF